MRNLTKTIVLVSLLAPTNGYPLGIGDIKLHSALNQDLNAEISLVLSAGEKASDITVNLASPDKFDEAGVPWASFLPKIKFATVVGANGSVIIKISSREVVKEPFLDFLLEVSWPKGRLYREFTVLVDPPSVYEQPTLPVFTPSESYEPEQAVIPQRQSTPRQHASAERSLSGAGEYGPIRRNDTLWEVAERVSGQEGVSVEQMMIALYEKNPHAFYKENVNALMAGKTLKIPEREVILKLSRRQALAEFNRQTTAWKNRLAPAPVETASAPKETPDNQLTLAAPTEADVTGNVTVAPENGQVTANKKADEALPTTSKTIDKEAEGVVSPVNDVLQAKIAELEKQLSMMQQIVALKDQQLAAIQNQSQAKPVEQAKPIQPTPSQTELIKPEVQPEPLPPPVTKPIVQPAPAATASSDIYYLWVGGIGAGTLSLLGWLWWRQRKLDEEAVGPNLFTSAKIGEASEYKSILSTSVEKDSAKHVDALGAGSLFSDFTFDDFDTFNTDQGEIDPVSEADVYLAYGRYQQAEELMRDVIKDQPGRDEYKLKLLEIFYSNENKQAFETYATELVKAGKKDDVEFWAKVTEMGSEICQDSALFSTGAEEFPKRNNIANRVEPGIIKNGEEADINKFDFSPPSLKQPVNNEAIKEKPQAKDNLLDYDLTSFEDVADDEKNNETINFDFSTFAIDDAAESSETDEGYAFNAQDIKDDDEFGSFDFDLGFNDTETKESDLAVVDNDADDSHQRTDFLTDKASGLNYSFADDFLDVGFDKSAEGLNGQDFDQLAKFDVFDLTDMDQLETKLDLAKAYIDMSDADAAKDIAWEVLEKGTAEQKKVAQALLNDLK